MPFVPFHLHHAHDLVHSLCHTIAASIKEDHIAFSVLSRGFEVITRHHPTHTFNDRLIKIVFLA